MALDSRHHLNVCQQLIFQDLSIAMGLGVVLKPAAISSGGDRIDQAGEIQGLGFGQGHGPGLQQFTAADQLFEPGHAKHAQQLTHLFGHKQEEIHHVLGHAGEALAQVFFLGRHPHRAVIGVANAGHDAALGDHRHRAEAVFLGAQQGGDDHVPAGLEAAIGPQQHPIAQAILEQGPVHLGEA